ncbi:hypothetical protein LY474_00760 [Myxococcus stipitatus]|uniref:hypothetical protein n=1 Tax=Myxococcus stipitatus TaxID=83455 RepID=UPI001F350414|nr:hypothetical protein [Myxococcus stipitatus]MCE9666327.1 hypothetical protein [Myxococcus stipitatus]
MLHEDGALTKEDDEFDSGEDEERCQIGSPKMFKTPSRPNHFADLQGAELEDSDSTDDEYQDEGEKNKEEGGRNSTHGNAEIVRFVSRIEEVTGMELLEWAHALDYKFKSTTKNIAVLAPRGKAQVYGVKALRTQIPQARRMGIKVTLPNFIEFWGIHANASRKGGKAAVEHAWSEVKKNPRMLWGGDFNYPFEDATEFVATNSSSATAGAGPSICRPVSWQGDAQESTDLGFTQWSDKGGLKVPSSKLHLQGEKVKRDIKPNGVIDYVVHGGELRVEAVKNCPNEAAWKEVLAQFDHCPVVFDVELCGGV